MPRLNSLGQRLLAALLLAALHGCGGTDAPPPTPTAPGFARQPLDQTVPLGQTAVFTVSVTGNGAISYQWMKDGAAIASASGDALTISSVKVADAGSYTCVVTDTLNGTTLSGTSSPAVLVINTPPLIGTQPDAHPTPVQGAALTLKVTATGNGVLSYQWQKNSAAIAGATAATFTIASVQASDAGAYTCVVTATLNGTTTQTTSAAAVVGVAVPPVISAQPEASQTIVQGAAASFTVSASAPGLLSYQWTKGGTAISGATSATLRLAAVQAADAGVYACVVKSTTTDGASASVTSANATLVVNAPPTVTITADQTDALGATATLTVTATGSGTLSYQWTKNGVAITGATAATLTLPNLAATDTGLYACVVTNTLNGTAASASSTSAAVSVIPGPAISTQPVSQTVAQGGSASFTVAATGTGTLSYQWTKNGVAITGATAATLAIAAVAPADAASYACVVTNTRTGVASLGTSAAALLTVNQTPVFTTQAADQTQTLGGSVTFSVAATSNGALSYQWLKDGTALAAGAQASGATIASVTAALLVVANVSAADAGAYTCKVTSALGGTTSPAATSAANLIFNAAPAIAAQPAATPTFVAGSAGSLSVTATSAKGALSYQWFKGTAPTGAAVSGATAATYAIASVAKATAGSYYCVVTSALGGTTATTTSASAAVSVNWAPAFLSDPAAAQAFKEGTNTSAQPSVSIDTSAVAASAALSYQWFKGGVALVDGAQASGSALAGATTRGLSFTGFKVADAGSYTCTITSTLNGTTAALSTGALAVTVVALPSITGQPASVVANQGDSPTFTTTASVANGALTYQWYRGTPPTGAPGSISPPFAGSTLIAGATSATLALSAVQTADNGSYFCLLANKLGAVVNYWVSNGATLTVNPVVVQPVVTIDPFVKASRTGLVASTQDQGVATYAWTMTGGTITAGASSRTVTFTAPASGTVTATVTVTSTQNSLSGSASSTVHSFSAPDLATPTLVHPGDAWMRAFTSTSNNGVALPQTLQWSIAYGSATGTILGSATGGSAAFSVSADAASGSSLTLSVTSQQNADNLLTTTSAQITAKTGVWVTKDGGAATIGAYPTATTLQNGLVLIAGGASAIVSANTTTALVSAAAQLYDPATGFTVLTGSMNKARTQHTATLLPNGTVLVTGGLNNNNGAVNYEASAELWDPSTGTWTTVGSMAQARGMHSAVLVNGKVAVLGGRYLVGSTTTYLSSIELFDPGTNSWTAGPNLVLPRALATATILPAYGNKVLLVGGATGTSLTQPEIYDPVAATSTSLFLTGLTTPTVNKASRSVHTATLLSAPATAQGRVLIVGGSQSPSTAEIFDPTIGSNPPYSGTFTATTATPKGGPFLGSGAQGRSQHTASLLPDGTVLLAGGSASAYGPGQSYEIYNPGSGAPTAGTFTNGTTTASGMSMVLNGSHSTHAAATLLSGQVVLIGGMGTTSGATSQIEQFTPAVAGGSNPGTITVPAGLDVVRTFHTATRLADGRVLVVGGQGTGTGATTNAGVASTTAFLSSARIYNPATNTWSATGSMAIGRVQHAAALLPSGDVLVTGGRISGSGITNTAELWNHTSDTWSWLDGSATSTASLMTSSRYGHSMVTLQDGRVLLVGGTGLPTGTTGTSGVLATSELFNPGGAGGWFTVPAGANPTMSQAKWLLSPVRLASGQVLVAGGITATDATSGVEVFDPATNSWLLTAQGYPLFASLKVARANHTATLLPGGQVLLVAGTTSANGFLGWDSTRSVPLGGVAVEVYDPAANGGTGGSTLPSSAVFTTEARLGHTAHLLPNGKVLIVGGTGSSASFPNYSNTNGAVSVELYDPATNTFSATDPLKAGRPSSSGFAFTGTSLANGDVLLVGGTFADKVAPIYRP